IAKEAMRFYYASKVVKCCIIIRGEKENTSIFTKISDIFQKKTENSPAERKNHRKRKFLLPSERKTAIIDICVKIT
ncbi:hypothetical protein, partial [uncultured Mitsuokella sp.]|uniref:hypothetical protein n=1 Tax=uncultured Mitsuokella sp. TaxID=453120 RepID=UPI0026759241